MTSHEPARAPKAPAMFAVLLGLATVAFAQDAAKTEKADPAAGLFDDDAKPAEKPRTPEKPKATDKPRAAAKSDSKFDGATVGFTQENVAAQMAELEERMFRLSEALRSLEPENASRLGLALKFSREELILHQMKDTQKLLKDAQVAKAETEARELLAKLEHLRSLLLAEDLDFQMKLARLRQMRETLGQLERIIKEEKRELAWSRKADEEQTKAKHDTAEFLRFEHDQRRNRGAADSLARTSSRLGQSGVALQKDLIRAGGSMREAEGELAKSAAKPAAADQAEALKHLIKSRDDLAKAVEGLLTELRVELQAKIKAELTEMHEIQLSIRETTESQAPRVAQKSRTAIVTVVGLAAKEAELAERTEHLRALTEETEFGIALPTSLRVLAREMTRVQGWLKDGDASTRTVTLERRIEEDLLGLLEAMRRLPPTTPPPPGSPLPSDLRARERELNRLIAELKMIRLLQSRLNDDTFGVDQGRPPGPDDALPASLRREIEALKSSQDEIRDSLARISRQIEPTPELEKSDIERRLERLRKP